MGGVRRVDEGIVSGVLEAKNSLVVTSSASMHDTALDLVSSLTKNGFSGIYLTLNRPHVSLVESLSRRNVGADKVFFIDCVTSGIHHITHFKGERVLYADSPRDLGRNGSILRAVEHYVSSVPGEKFVLIDALRTMLLYNEELIVVNFIKALVEKLAEYGVKLVVLTRKDHDEELVKDLSTLFDLHSTV